MTLDNPTGPGVAFAGRPHRCLCLRTVRRRRGREQAALAAQLHAGAVADRDAGRLSPALAAGERALKIVEHGPGEFLPRMLRSCGTRSAPSVRQCATTTSPATLTGEPPQSWTATTTTIPSRRRGSTLVAAGNCAGSAGVCGGVVLGRWLAWISGAAGGAAAGRAVPALFLGPAVGVQRGRERAAGIESFAGVLGQGAHEHGIQAGEVGATLADRCWAPRRRPAGE